MFRANFHAVNYNLLKIQHFFATDFTNFHGILKLLQVVFLVLNIF